MLPSPLFSPEHIFFEILNTIFNNLALDMQICRLQIQHTTSAETQSRCMFNEICRGKRTCGAKPHLTGMKVCVCIQKALLFFLLCPVAFSAVCSVCSRVAVVSGLRGERCTWLLCVSLDLAYDELSVGFDPEMERSSECHTETSQSKSLLSLYLSFVVSKHPSSVTI